MKTLFLIFSLFAPITLATPNLSTITKAISEGDASTLGSYLDSTVELTILDKQDVLNKAQATESLRAFFGKNKPRTYNVVHQGSSKGSASHYTIGDMQAAGGNYRVYLYYKSGGGAVIIQEIRIEK